MNKQEAINELMSKSREIIFGDDENVYLSRKRTIELISQIDTQPKVVVPKFIDSFIRYAKAEDMSLFIAMDNAQNKESEWIIKNEETFARAWLDGYEVEKEQLYVVEIPNNGGTLVLSYINNAIKLVDGNKHFPDKFTKEAIEYAGFKWAWQFAKPVEEEVSQ